MLYLYILLYIYNKSNHQDFFLLYKYFFGKGESTCLLLVVIVMEDRNPLWVQVEFIYIYIEKYVNILFSFLCNPRQTGYRGRMAKQKKGGKASLLKLAILIHQGS